MVGDGPRIGSVRLAVDPGRLDAFYAAVKQTPAIASVALLGVSRERFGETIQENMTIMTTVYTALAVIITFGVIYNTARIQLSERARELASLRVLGFTRAEVSSVLLIELAVIVLLSQPLGWISGYGFAWLVVRASDSDLFRIPFVVEQSTFAVASLVVLAVAVLAALIVRRRVRSTGFGAGAQDKGLGRCVHHGSNAASRILALAAVAGGFAYALREQPSLVDVAKVSEGPMRVTIREEGVTRVREVYTVSTVITGHLARSVLEEGDGVKANETVVASIHPLDPPLIDKRTEAELLAARDAARSAVGIAEIELQRSEAGLRLAEDDLKRAVGLFKPGVISEAALQRVNNVVDIQRAAVDAARTTIVFRRAELASAEARLLQPDPLDPTEATCCVNLLAPVDGTVLAVFAKSEQAVVAGMKIAEIGDTGALEIAVDLLSADAVRISPGTKALDLGLGRRSSIERDRPTRRSGRVHQGIGTRHRGTARQRRAGSREPERRLGHGYRVFAEMTIWECGKCLQVPISALFRNGNDGTSLSCRATGFARQRLRSGT